ncbi:MAG: CoA transferase [Acidimicrobiales bacterium]
MTRSVGARNAEVTTDARSQVSAWAASGAMALTGSPWSGSVGPPAGMVPKLLAVAELLRAPSPSLGGIVDVDPLALLGERAAISGFRRRGDISCGGGTRLLPTIDRRWVAVTLARPEDVELVPAWLEVVGTIDDPWSSVADAVAARPVDALIDHAVLLGLPVAVLPSARADGAMSADPVPADRISRPERSSAEGVVSADQLPIRSVRVGGPTPATGPMGGIVVLDLSSLWAGPLCGSLLAAAGATVIKVESASRPDGARRGPSAFFDLLNAGKQSVALDLRTAEGVTQLHRLLAAADVVIEASRPRALEQLGVDAMQVLASGRTRVWASITGHGRNGVGRDRVAFGDDAAVAGGLVCWAGERPLFCADAVADPLTGLVAAAGIIDALAAGGQWLLDLSMAEVATFFAGPTLPVPRDVGPVDPPRARVASGRGPLLGEHTAAVLAGVGR